MSNATNTNVLLTEMQSSEQTLQEKRSDLCLRLHLNRRLLQHKLEMDVPKAYSPRSMTMRFLSRQSTHQLLKKALGTAIGIQTLKSLHYGYSIVRFVRHAFTAKDHKST